ncbi:MAG: class I SAM-dependent methyltransferase [Chloroflexota bacterium]
MDKPRETVPVSSRQTRQNYDRLSRWYDLFSASERRFTLLGLRLLDLHAGERVLELGPGTGHALQAMAQGGAGRVVGVELSSGMICQAQKRLSAIGRAGDVFLLQADALRIPLAAASFEAVFLSFTLELFPDPALPILLSECRRVLAPGGRVGIVSLAADGSRPVQVYEWFHRRFPGLVDCRPLEIGQVLGQAGYHIENTTRKAIWGLPVDILVARPL